VDGRQVDGRQVDGRQVDGRQVDGRQVDGRQVDGRQVDGRQVDGRQVDGQQVDGRQVDGQQVDGQQVDDSRWMASRWMTAQQARIKKPSRWAGQDLGRIWAGSKRAINNLYNICLHIHPTLNGSRHSSKRNWGTRSDHHRHLSNHMNKERFYKNTRDERRFLFCFYT
jgi:hypothetical protein